MLPSLTALALGVSIAPAQETAQLVRDLNRSPGTFTAGIGWAMPVDDGVVFQMDSIATGQELWHSDGTPRGTRLLKDIIPGSWGSAPNQPVAVGSKVAFRSTDFDGNPELWLTDGTESGTVSIAALAGAAPGTADLWPRIGSGGGLFYERYYWESDDPVELWFSDGTPGTAHALNPVPEGGDARLLFGSPYGYVSDGTWVYFLANEDELWRSDGTITGTTKLADLDASAGASWPVELAIASGRLFIERNDSNGNSAVELWTCSLEGGSLTKLGPDAISDWLDISSMTAVGDDLFFQVGKDGEVSELWCSDGTTGGTRPVPLVNRGDEGYMPKGDFHAWKGVLYFAAEGTATGRELWRSDGTAAGTRLVRETTRGVSGGGPVHLQATGDLLYFQAPGPKGWELWSTNGNTASTHRVARLLDQNPYIGTGPQVTVSQDRLYFTASRGAPANALWAVRPAGRGVQRLTTPEKSSASAFPANSSLTLATPYTESSKGGILSFVQTKQEDLELWRIGTGAGGKPVRALWKAPLGPLEYGSALFRGKAGDRSIFTLLRASTGQSQIWATDESARGTRLLQDLGTAAPGDFIASGGNFYYSVVSFPASTSSPEGLWKTDGTAAGTVRIASQDGTIPLPKYGEMVEFKGGLYFLAESVDSGIALWRSDGTPVGTVRVADPWSAWEGDRAFGLTVIGDRLSISVQVPQTQLLWTSDGTAEGTVQVQDGPDENTLLNIGPSFDLGGLELFVGRGPSTNDPYEWWRSDGTDEGTFPVLPGVTWQHLSPFTKESKRAAVAGSRIFYNGLELTNDNLEAELWVTDGSAAGTHKVKDIEPGPDGSEPSNFLAVGNDVYFTAGDSEHGTELWRSDGTEEGTVLVTDIEPGPVSSHPQDLKVMNGKLYFHAVRSSTGRELYSVDLPE